ncbi:MAG: Holliday junction branch migration DNA helicase RuvB [Planctomycetota bacterium]|nr:Holliday junction branch migration DNA helicase RuvB [Planctomycetota bacterium]
MVDQQAPAPQDPATPLSAAVVAPEVRAPDEGAFDQSLRPRSLEEFHGQVEIVRNLELAIRAARERGEALDHLLLSGLPGLGKTTLAHLVANASGSALYETAAPTLQRAADLAGLLTRLERGDVLFIDEIHRLPAAVEEYLYAAMEDFALDILLDQGPSARSVRIDLPRFTLVGATTREGMLTAPLRSRFGIHERLEPYDPPTLARILQRSARLLGVGLAEPAATYLAERSRGTPRVANRFLRRVRDLAQLEADNYIDLDIARRGLERIGVDAHGLTRVDRLILSTIARAEGRPLGLKTLAAAVGEDERTLEEVYEPHLLREGLLVKTSQGRSLTSVAWSLVETRRPGDLFA